MESAAATTTTPKEEPQVLLAVLLDEKHYAEKRDKAKTHLFSRNYLSDGSQDLLEADLLEGYEDLLKGTALIYEEEISYAYWTGTIKNYYFDYHVTPDLGSISKELAAFKIWFESVCKNWMTRVGLKVEVKPYTRGKFWLKVTGVLPAISPDADGTATESAAGTVTPGR